MSSIYDALRRIQGEKGAWAAPPVRTTEQPAPKGVRAGWIAACAAVFIAVCAAGIYYGVYVAGGGKAGNDTSVPKAHHAPGASVAAGYKHHQAHPQAVQQGAAPQQANPAGLPQQAMAPGTSPQALTPGMPPQAVSPGAAMGQAPATPAATMPGQPPATPATDTLDGYLKAGDKYFMNRDYENALLTYNKALHYFGRDVRVLNNIGSVYLAQGQPRQAIHYFQQSNGISKDYVEPIYNLACAYARLGDPAKAVTNLRKAVRLNPEAKKWAAADPDLMTLKGRGEFDRLIGAQ